MTTMGNGKIPLTALTSFARYGDEMCGYSRVKCCLSGAGFVGTIN